ncbi:MAG: DUF4178 domain-containing protein [Acidobacteriota bacterium]
MSARAAQCPNCGAQVRFRTGASLVSICPQCKSAVARKGADLEAIGTVADLVPTSSPFKVGMDARPQKGTRPFHIAGRLQLSTGEGTWDEWYVGFTDGTWGWLAEAQGGFWLMTPVQPPEVPAFEALAPGGTLDLGGYGTFAITEVREATYSSAQGELPFVAPPGSVFRYADLSGADGSLATLDYGDGPGLDGFYVGKPVALESLGIADLVAWSDRTVSVRALALNCPNCGGALQLKDPANTVRIACPSCGSLLGSADRKEAGPPSKFTVLEKLAAVPFKPRLPLGAEGTLRGHRYAILGVVQKTCSSDGEDYFWTEYLLKEEKSEAYHWLAESNGHYTLLEPVPAGEVKDGSKVAIFRSNTYRVFSRNKARVAAVLGEFYWAVRTGEETEATDYVSPPRMLSKEKAKKEIAWTEGAYVPPAEIAAAFALKEPLPSPEGVGACQPWPHAETARLWWKTAWFLILASIVVYFLARLVTPHAVVYDQTFDLVDAARGIYAARGAKVSTSADWSQTDEPAAKTAGNPIAAREAADNALAAARAIVSEPFETKRGANLAVDLWAPTNNNWVQVSFNLISEATGEVRSFDMISDRYAGNDGGESWSEGRQNRRIYVPRIPAGKWVLRLDPETEAGKAPPSFRVRLTSGVPHMSHLVWVILLLLVIPTILSFRKLTFEGRRWAESDFTSAGGVRDANEGDDE